MGSVIAFAQQKGGSGKTTMLAHLAAAKAASGKSVAIVDLDPQGSLSHWHEIGRAEGIDLIETSSYRIGSDLDAARAKYDLTLVDCPGNAAAVLENAIRAVDLVVLPCQTSAMDRWATGSVLEMARAEKTPAVVVLNRAPSQQAATDEARAAFKNSGVQVMNSQFGNRVAFARAFGDGKTALDLAGQSLAKAEVAAFSKETSKFLKR